MLLCRIKGKAFPLGGSRLKSELASALPLKPVFWSPDVGPSNCSREGQAAVKVTSLALPLPNSLHCIFIPNYSPLIMTFADLMKKQKLYILLMVLPTFLQENK